MAKTFFERIAAFITAPKKAFDDEKKTSLKDTILYGFKGMLLFAIPFSIVTTIMGTLSGEPTSLLMIPLTLIIIPFVGLAGGLLSALWYHLWAYVFGAREGWENTAKAAFFGNSPVYILGWIPLVNIAISIWSLILFGIGLKHLQKLSTGRTIAAILMAILIPTIIIVIVLVWLIMTYGSAIFATNETTTPLAPY